MRVENLNVKVGDCVRSHLSGIVYRVVRADHWEIYVGRSGDSHRFERDQVTRLTDVEVLEAKLKGLIYGE